MERDLRALLDRVAGLGGFFGLPGAWPSHDHTAAELYEGDAFGELAERVRARLGGERRVVLSVTHLGYVARLLSPFLGVAVVAGATLVVPPESLLVRQTPEGGLRLALGTGASVVDGTGGLARELADRHLLPLAARLRPDLAPTLLAGNAASALAGAVRVLPPGLRPEGARVLAGLLERPPLVGAFRSPGVRRTCCLFLKLPGGGRCGDCPVVPRL
ncbi:(2Fe-2S)-binding protein [Phytomonospora endophytica]|uniref:Ferric siderophore reductase C-terminal domain-containing protein n=1 Tax=Phytomonospora endophytica TaxID=714109 RepID=A0A841G6J1_9ACTN|nr:(2Fe-2S)-binding protein [Phytomonospora endophytica]MBB6039690.1 hypothetical protein [Phytomonospora endophytica]GIG65591.1 hypothetical protein Pen01_18860 [Phytomonospora endophytica]